MAPKKNDHMGDMSGMPKMPMQNYQYDKNLDASVKSHYQPMFNMDGQPVVMEGAFKARRDAQIKRRKAQGR